MQLAMTLFLGVNFPGSTIYVLATNPTAWASTLLVSRIFAIIAAISAVVAIGLYIVKSDFSFYAVIAAIFFTFAETYFEFYQRIIAVTRAHGYPDITILILFIPLTVPWLIILLDWIRGRD